MADDTDHSEKKRRASVDSIGKRKASLDFGKRRGSLSFARWFRRDREVSLYGHCVQCTCSYRTLVVYMHTLRNSCF